MPLQGVTNGCALTQGVASLALGYALVGLCLSASRRRPLVQPVLAMPISVLACPFTFRHLQS